MFGFVRDIVKGMGYPGIALLMFIENVFPPIPSEIIVPFAGFVASTGDLTLVFVIVAAVIGSVLGALPLYALGHKLGQEKTKEWFEDHGKWFLVTRDDIERAEEWFRKHGKLAVVIGRLVPAVRSLISIPAGIARMNIWLFLGLSAIGTAIWTTALALIGSALGENYGRVSDYLDPASWVVVGIAVVWIVVRAARQYRQRHAA